MPVTYELIASNVLGSNAASVTFSAIPATYTDLVLRVSGRSQNATGFLIVRFNATGTYSETDLRGNGSAASSVRSTGDGQMFGQGYLRLVGSGMTANTFNSAEIYIPNYAGSQAKLASAFSVTEDNTTSVEFITAGAGLSDLSAAITSIVCTTAFLAGSSFYLYGIKKS
jgi:hypothetical protein